MLKDLTDTRSCTLILLSLDERDALRLLLPRLPLDLFARVIAVDGGSTDGSIEAYREWGIDVRVQSKPGRGNAFLYAQHLVETEHVVFFSVDGNEDPEDLPRIVCALSAGSDLVIAGRFRRPGAESDDSDDPLRIRRTGATAIGWLVGRLWRTGVCDATNGYRGFRTAALRQLGLDAPHNEIELQSTIRAAKLGMRILELPTRERPRLAGVRKATAGTWTLGTRALATIVRELSLGRSFSPVTASRGASSGDRPG